MANEAYRAVFLRVHPTGKMVLSLTTEADGHEGEYAQRSPPHSASRRSTSRSFPPTPIASATATATTPAPPAGAGRHRQRRPRRSSPRPGCWPGWPSTPRPESVSWQDGAFVPANGVSWSGGGAKTIADLALYAHGTGALPPGVEGGLDAQTVYRD